MQRRFRPMVPAPASCPMPDKQRYAEKRDRLFLLYLQPWVLEKAWALPGVVPHLSDLNEVRDDTEPDVIRYHSYSEAWKKYISQNIVSRHAHRIIIQFMAACCSKSKTAEPQEPEVEPSANEPCPPSDLLLDQVHNLIDALGKLTPRVVKVKAMGQAPDEDKEAGEDVEGEDPKISLQMSNALHTVNDLWQRDTEKWSLSTRNMTNSRVDLAQQKPKKRRTASDNLARIQRRCNVALTCASPNPTLQHGGGRLAMARHHRRRSKHNFWSMSFSGA